MTEIYSKLPKVIDRDLDELRISVDYEKGGYSYFSGEMNRRGIYVYIKPIHRAKGMISTRLLSDTYSNGYKVFIKELSRKSQKQIDEVFNKINNVDFIQEITLLYSNKLNNELIEKLIRKINN